MTFLTILGIAFALAMDAFAVAIAAGTRLRRPTFRQYFRLSFHFGLFQFMMPILGWLAGVTVSQYISAVDHWIAFALLLIVGVRMIYGALHPDGEDISVDDPSRKWSLVMLSLATSIDALAVGVTLALIDVKVLYPSAIIGIVACIMTAVGLGFGSRLGRKFGGRMEFTGGVILILIGANILRDHLFA